MVCFLRLNIWFFPKYSDEISSHMRILKSRFLSFTGVRTRIKTGNIYVLYIKAPFSEQP